MKQAVTMDDIAHAAGVSLTVVSKVLGTSQSKNVRVGKETAERVCRIASEMNYVPNINARALAGRSSHLIGILQDTQAPLVRYEMLRHLEQRIGAHGYQVIIGEMHDDFEGMCNHYRLFRQYGVDGVICISHDYPSMNDRIADFFLHEKDVVFFGPPRIGSFPCVSLDFGHGIRAMIRHLQKLGRSRIGITLTKPFEYSDVMTIREAFLSVFPGREDFIYNLSGMEENVEQMRREAGRILQEFIIPGKLDALIAANDYWGMLFLDEFRRAGLRVPEDIAVIGNDNVFAGSCCSPTLSTLDMATEECTCHLVDMLMRGLRGEPGETFHLVRPKLILRQSAPEIRR